ncbi:MULTISPECIES: SurA N-terminal domain-containing protein [Pseudoalteromonas]|uniref:SurA N-terminal domain-containing protein n=1 Tax=Pseudoalteromonas TaxID=53246 RepID=UPI00057C96C2|nr:MULTISPECIES: SurA N-terminal domain-containing protein [Pseudoalteromonas]KID32952.1 peptidylprolyl isomerase [Pseudoalteromonas flavipulchra NCIMB 2033 = ATCC BAA-314]MBD0781113.1 peptidylprolyl isomerase [Pseudoalteromonas flavipulchra]MBE0373527.1 peptidyl-prolyl cis-trans isomerase D [Pseudoalteromonas flavipulchra NCIMB 2033 = ATCC BAA-314]RZG16702.1 peptidylprolyl isomerase [Pseudoalteromonas sp. CO342X]
MLEKIREGSQGPAAKIVLGLVILSFALAGIGGYLGQTTEQPVAEVNGVKISQTKFSRAYSNERARLEQQFGEYFAQIAADPNYMAQIRQGVVDQLVQQELQTQLAKELGLRVSDEQVKKAIVEMPYFQIGGEFSNDRYLQVIRQMNFQPDSFREYLRDEMTRAQLISAVAGTDFVLKNELQQSIALQQQTRAIDYAVLSKELVKDEVSVSDEEVQNYYDLNQTQFQAPELVAVNYIELKAEDLAPAEPVTEEALKTYYEEQKNQYLEPERRRVSHILVDASEDAEAAKQKADEILTELNNGADFAVVAEEKSDDVVSAELGGDLDWIERDMMDPAFEDAAFALAAVGDVSEVVESEFGFHIIKLTDIQRQQAQSFDDVKDDLRAELEKAAKIDAFYQKQTRVAELAFEMADSLQDAAEAAGVEIKSTELVSRNALPEPLNSPAISNTIFTPELLEDRVNSEVLEVAPEHIVVVRVAEHKAAATKPLEEVSAQIKTQLSNEKASTLIAEKAQSLFEQLQGGSTLAEIAKAQSIEVKSVSELKRRSYDVPPAIAAEAFKLPQPGVAETESALVELGNGDSAFVVLKSVTTPEVDGKVDAQQKQSITASYANKNYLELLAALEAKSEVKRPQLQVTEQQ